MLEDSLVPVITAGGTAIVTTVGTDCQVVVFLAAYATDTGRTLIDRELYLPATWCQDAERCRVQRIPRQRAKAVVTKLELGWRMVERCCRAKAPSAGWPPTASTGRTASSARHSSVAASRM
jgi:hypothetical protein